MEALKIQAKPAPDYEVIITRLLDAPRRMVFEAFSEPKRLARWWGPRGFTNPVCTLDARPGGAYRIVTRSPTGAEYPIKGVYLEVVALERVACTQNLDEHPTAWHEELCLRGADMPIGETLLTATFEEQEGRTKLTLRNGFESAATRDAFKDTGLVEGWTQSLDRLEHYLTGR